MIGIIAGNAHGKSTILDAIASIGSFIELPLRKKNIPSLNDIEMKEYKEEIKNKYLEILYNNPSGFTLTAKMITNYRQLKTIYSQRKNHRLPEWREFCKWIETLPYSELITQN